MTARLMTRLIGAACLIALAGLAMPALSRPADGKDLDGVPADLRLVPPDAMFFASVRVADVLASEVGKAALKSPGAALPLAEAERFGFALSGVERMTMFARPGGLPTAIYRTKKPFDAAALKKAQGTGTEYKAHGKTIHVSPGGEQGLWIVDDRTAVTGEFRSVVLYLAAMAKAGKAHPLAAELKAAGGHHATLAVLPETAFRLMAAHEAAREEMWKKGPPKFKDFPRKDGFKGKDDSPPPKDAFKDGKDKNGARDEFLPVRFQKDDGPRKDKGRPLPDPSEIKEPPLKLGTIEEARAAMGRRTSEAFILTPFMIGRSLLITLDVGAEIKAALKADFAKRIDAMDGETILRMALIVARDAAPRLFRGPHFDAKEEPFAGMLKAMQDAVKSAEVKRSGFTVEATASLKYDPAPLVKWMKEQAPVITDSNNLKQIGLAFHNYHDTFGHFPQQANYDKDGKPLLSWRVHILPYLDEGALYRQFKLDEPWDSPHNKKLLAKMPKVYARVTGGAAEPGLTQYQGFVARGKRPGTALVVHPYKVAIRDITDGTSNTFLVAESSKAVPWTKPEDIGVDEMGVPKLGGQFKGFFQAVMCDGSVRKIQTTTSEKTLRAYITRSGREPIPKD